MTALILLRDFQASQIEFWMPTAYPGYDVSSFGRVRSWWQLHSLGVGKGTSSSLGDFARILKNQPQSGGYRAVAVARSAKGRRPQMVAVHRLVAKAFVPEMEGSPHVNHLNCIKADCRSGNLEWTVPKRNTQHGMDAGVIKVVGVQNPMAKLTEAEVLKIKALRYLGVSILEVANAMGIRYSHVWSVDAGRTWKHVKLKSPFHF